MAGFYNLKNDADKQDIEALSQWINHYQSDPSQSRTSFPDQLNIGGLQGLYAQLQLTYNEYIKIFNLKGTDHQMRTIRREIRNTGRLNQSIAAEEEKYKEEIELAEKEVERAEALLQDGVISQQDYEYAKAKHSQIKRQLEHWAKSKIQNDIRSDQLRLEGLKIAEDRQALLLQYQFQLDGLISQLKSGILSWHKENHIITEDNGIIEYNLDLYTKKSITPNEIIGYIIPDRENNPNLVKVIAGAIGIAKLDIGTKAIIKLEAHPYKEYGVIEAEVTKMTQTPYIDNDGNQQYQIEIDISDPIITTSDKSIEYKPNMKAQVSLIAEDLSILERVDYRLLTLSNNF